MLIRTLLWTLLLWEVKKMKNETIVVNVPQLTRIAIYRIDNIYFIFEIVDFLQYIL